MIAPRWAAGDNIALPVSRTNPRIHLFLTTQYDFISQLLMLFAVCYNAPTILGATYLFTYPPLIARVDLTFNAAFSG